VLEIIFGSVDSTRPAKSLFVVVSLRR
jgi:hypothetical protein